jgi:Haloacid dehalogenase-like hydrolase
VGRELATRVPLFAGDIVPAKKPDPAIYQLTLAKLELDPGDTLVVEDSRNGLLAAVGAELRCLVTVNGYTRHEGFDEAVLVVSELGDPGRPPIEVLANRSVARPGDYITLDDVRDCLRAATAEELQELSAAAGSGQVRDPGEGEASE